MPGIDRIRIISDWKHDYIDKAKNIEPFANKVYYDIFNWIAMPLKNDQVNIIECTLDEAKARYDYSEGIDIIFHFADGQRATCQEKLLDYWDSTLTIEEIKGKTGKPGAWYYCTSQYYFVGYSNNYASGDYSLRDYMMVCLPCLKRLTALGIAEWKFNTNGLKGSYNKFRYIRFDDVPTDCIVLRKENNA